MIYRKKEFLPRVVLENDSGIFRNFSKKSIL
jgi:hypothetical protein